MNSCIYQGTVSHVRYSPVEHRFKAALFMTYLDLDEIDDLFAERWLWSAEHASPIRFRRSDYPGDPATPLDDAIRSLVAERTGRRPTGPVRLLTQLRYFGYGFNPASFFYCFDDGGRHIEAVVTHVTNTPWGEQHSYVVVPADSADEDQDAGPEAFCAETPKRFHVSPFMPMDLTHVFRFAIPARTLSAGIVDRRDGKTVFSAQLRLDRRPLTGTSLASMLVRYPFPGLRVIATIYYQALVLYWKRVPFYPHPKCDSAQ